MTDIRELARGMYDDLRAGSDVGAGVDRYMADDFVEHESVPGMGNTRDTSRQMFQMSGVLDLRALTDGGLEQCDPPDRPLPRHVDQPVDGSATDRHASDPGRSVRYAECWTTVDRMPRTRVPRRSPEENELV